MFINPKHAIAEGWVKFPEWMSEEFQQKCIQPNALDFTVDHLYGPGREQCKPNEFVLSESTKVMRPMIEIEACNKKDDTDTLYWKIPANEYVDIMSDFYVTIPAGVAAMFIVRSTLNRNGLFITSGLYDSGFENYAGMILHNRGQDAFIAPRTRIGQLIFVKSEDSGILYNGRYNDNKGQHWSASST